MISIHLLNDVKWNSIRASKWLHYVKQFLKLGNMIAIYYIRFRILDIGTFIKFMEMLMMD